MVEKKKNEPGKEKTKSVPLGETEPIDALSTSQPPEDLPDVNWPLEKLVDAVTTNSNMLVRSNAVNSLAKIGGSEVVDALVEALKDPEDTVKTSAMVGLANLGKDLVQERMIDLVQNDEKEDVRAGAAWVLGEMVDEKSVETLKKVAEKEENALVRVHAKASLRAYEQSQKKEKIKAEKKE